MRFIAYRFPFRHRDSFKSGRWRWRKASDCAALITNEGRGWSDNVIGKLEPYYSMHYIGPVSVFKNLLRFLFVFYLVD